MSAPRRVVRKLQPVGPQSFDEQLWPIYAGIVVLGAYLMGVVLAYLHFDDPRFFSNATTWLCVVTFGTGMSLWSVGYVQNRVLRRTVFLSLILSLIVNLSFLVIMAGTAIFSPFWLQEQPQALVERPKPEVVIPEYPLWNEQQQQSVPQEFERPVETGQPDAEERLELTRQTNEAAMLPTEKQPSTAAATKQLSHAKPQRVEVPSAPRRRETLAKLSRQPLQSELRISKTPVQPAQPKPPAPAPERLQAQATRMKASEQQVDRPAFPQPADQARQRSASIELARRSASDSPELDAASVPTLSRALNRPRSMPRTSTPVDVEVTLARRTTTDAIQAANTLAEKRTTSAPESTTAVNLAAKVATNLPRANPTQVDRPDTSQLSDTTPRAVMTAATETATSTVAAAAPTESANAETTLASADARVQRQLTTPSPADATIVSPPSDTMSRPSPMAQARNESQPLSLSGEIATARTMARADLSANTSTGARVEVAQAIATSSDNPVASEAPSPSRLALSRSTMGVAGIGEAANLERGLAAPESPISISSASASRPRATQKSEVGPALAPSARALTRSLRAGEAKPKNSLQSQPIKTAMVPGATVPAADADSSSSTMRQLASNAASASVTAAQGTAEVDLGPTRVATDLGSGRAEGGGQPEITTGQQPRSLERQDSLAGRSQLRIRREAPENAAPVGRDQSPAREVGAAAARVAKTDLPEAGGASSPDAQVGPEASPEIRLASTPRSAAASQPPTSVVAGGGNRQVGKQARGLTIRTSAPAEVPSLASTEASTGDRRGQPLDAQGIRPARAAAGLLAAQPSDDVGALAGAEALDGQLTELPVLASSERADSGSDDGRSLPLASLDTGAPQRRVLAAAATTSTQVELDPEEFAQNLPSSTASDALEGVEASILNDDGESASGGAILVSSELPEVEGGLGERSALDAGIVSRRAQVDSELVSLQSARFLRKTLAGSRPNTPTSVTASTRAFQRRLNRKGEAAAGERGLPSPKTEAAIELGLVFLSRYQNSDGSWSLDFGKGRVETPADEQATIVSDTAATGLALLSFLGAGYHHQDDKYQEVVHGGVEFLRRNQDTNDGNLYLDQDPNSTRSAWLYSHAIATIAMCEAYGMTQDPGLKRPAQAAVDFIASSQHPTRGGWRYSPEYGSDTSVTGWMLMALKSAQLADLEVSEETFARVSDWLDLAEVSEVQPFLFRYNPYAPDTDQQRHGRQPTRAMTAVGLLMRLYLGWNRDDPNTMFGARTLRQNLPELGTSRRPRRDTYYWYYATQVMYHMGGEYWEEWNNALHPLLTETQVKQGELSGSWNPIAPVPDRWAAHGGRLYVTTLNLLSLEVFYRHLPIYEETSK